MKQKIYIETSIPSFNHDARLDAEIAARRKWTREWWDNHRDKYVLVCSHAVLDELGSENYPEQKREKALELISQVPLVPVESAISVIVQAYI